ncbi:unnamed protein product [Darwinula stevensoni]|uniref:Homeobox domain-containing protein n=1 Tax=Darwinula stevensoni TaxID=69355 RepID=A0A7R9AF61_9CRUS|nr:unnamed protein product [Darwinula stevensoni]CAG0902623.1 unnamed protein product [Darwinula stevensoni]
MQVNATNDVGICSSLQYSTCIPPTLKIEQPSPSHASFPSSSASPSSLLITPLSTPSAQIQASRSFDGIAPQSSMPPHRDRIQIRHTEMTVICQRMTLCDGNSRGAAPPSLPNRFHLQPVLIFSVSYVLLQVIEFSSVHLQLKELKKAFARSPYLGSASRRKLASIINLTEAKVKVIRKEVHSNLVARKRTHPFMFLLGFEPEELPCFSLHLDNFHLTKTPIRGVFREVARALVPLVTSDIFLSFQYTVKTR